MTGQLHEAERRLEDRFKGGEEQGQALIDKVSKTVIVDKLVPPKLMEFVTLEGELRLCYHGTPPSDASIHRHALQQLCQKCSLPITYVNFLQSGSETWKRNLLALNLNELFHQPEWKDRSGTPSRFLHRLVDGELRGFLSRRYNRHLASAPLLRSFVDTCALNEAKPIEAIATPVRVSLKCLLPYVFEVWPGEYVAVGTEWSNSDFGAGKHLVCQTVWRIMTGTSSVLDESISRVHLGSVIEESDIDMSDETALKEVEAQKSAIVDAVTAHLSTTTVERMVEVLRAARDQKIPWAKLRGQLGKFLGKADLEWLKNTLDQGTSIIDLPPINPDPDGARTPNAYWAAAALGALAAKTEDLTERALLQREAGRMLSPPGAVP